jgi:hypothetical protein
MLILSSVSFGWDSVMYLAIGLIAGLFIGFFVSRYLFKKQLKKNPPVTEKMIRVMYAQMGRKPSEKQIRQIMNSMNNNSL